MKNIHNIKIGPFIGNGDRKDFIYKIFRENVGEEKRMTSVFCLICLLEGKTVKRSSIAVRACDFDEKLEPQRFSMSLPVSHLHSTHPSLASMYLLSKYNSNKSSASSSSSTLKDELDDIVGDCIIKNSLPYNFVEDETFQSYTSILGKGTYSLPCISSFKTILNKRINMFFDSIKNEVSIISSSFERADGLPFPIVSLIHDTCTRKKLSVLGASICFISLDWKYKCKAICLIEINESKDSTYLASKIASLISQRFNWSISDILTAVSDTAASAQKISQTLLSNQGSLNHNNIKEENAKCI